MNEHEWVHQAESLPSLVVVPQVSVPLLLLLVEPVPEPVPVPEDWERLEGFYLLIYYLKWSEIWNDWSFKNLSVGPFRTKAITAHNCFVLYAPTNINNTQQTTTTSTIPDPITQEIIFKSKLHLNSDTLYTNLLYNKTQQPNLEFRESLLLIGRKPPACVLREIIPVLGGSGIQNRLGETEHLH